MTIELKKTDLVSGNESEIECFGDSLMNEPLVMCNMELGSIRQLNARGIGGQNATQIACRQGGIPVYITVSGNALSGATATAVTSISTQFLSSPATTATTYESGIVNGIYCLLTRTVVSSVETYSIYGYNNSTGAIPANSIFYPDTAYNSRKNVNWWMWGKNGTGSAGTLLEIYEKCISTLEAPRRVLIGGYLLSLNQTLGTSDYTTNIALNDSIRVKYPDNYVEVTAPTTAEMDYIKYTPTSQDLTDISLGVFPTGMRRVNSGVVDNVHLNEFGNAILGVRIADMLKKYGW